MSMISKVLKLMVLGAVIASCSNNQVKKVETVRNIVIQDSFYFKVLDDTLYVYGIGKMPEDFDLGYDEYSAKMWYVPVDDEDPDLYRDVFKVAVVQEGITNIKNGFFRHCYNLLYVNLPYSVVKIDSFAFWRSYNLISVTIPNEDVEVESYAFGHNWYLENIVVGGEVIEACCNVADTFNLDCRYNKNDERYRYFKWE